MVVARTAEQLVEQYEALVALGLADDDNYETEAILALVARDAIADRVAELDPSLRRRVDAADDRLVAVIDRVAAVLPMSKSHPPTRWWWHLHEGPGVRERATRLAEAR